MIRKFGLMQGSNMSATNVGSFQFANFKCMNNLRKKCEYLKFMYYLGGKKINK